MRPNPICINPAKKKIIKMAGRAFSILPSFSATIPAMTTILTAVIGAVGPEICVAVPPKRAAKKLIKIAPYNPALGPKPELTPNASARGRATMPAVIPPKRSPLRFENKFFIGQGNYYV
jgi:hypothetical protein